MENRIFNTDNLVLVSVSISIEKCIPASFSEISNLRFEIFIPPVGNPVALLF